MTIVGQGGEIVIGCLPSHHVEELMEIGEADIDEDDIENVTGKPWSELDDIWHFYGPFEDFELHDEVGHALGQNNLRFLTVRLDFNKFYEPARRKGLPPIKGGSPPTVARFKGSPLRSPRH